MAITVRENKSTSGKTHLSLDINLDGRRKKESLKLSFQTIPRNEIEKRRKKEALQLAKQIASQRMLEFGRSGFDLVPEYRTSTDFVAYAQEYIKDNHLKKEVKKYDAALKKLMEFADKKVILCREIDEPFLRRFVRFLERELNGETPSNYFKKLRQIIRQAVEDNLFRKDPAEKIRVRKEAFLVRDLLSPKELTCLWETPLNNDTIKRAFLFSAVTGLRFCDVNQLIWANVKGDLLHLIQLKTRKPLQIPLNADAVGFLGQTGNPNQKVFALPSHTACMKWLRKWTAEAGIEKKITWHCARHSFGTNLIAHKVDVSIASKLLGHSSIAQTQRYVSVGEQMKAEAVQMLPAIR